MASKPHSIRPAPSVHAAIANNGGGRGMSHRLAQICDRYLELLRRAPLPELSEAEVNALRDCMNGTLNEPAGTIRCSIWANFEDACYDGLAEKWEIDGPALLEKLKALTYAQELGLIEQIEAYWANAGSE